MNRSLERMKEKVRQIREEQLSFIRKKMIIEGYKDRDTTGLLTPRQLIMPKQLKFITEERLEMILAKRLSRRR